MVLLGGAAITLPKTATLHFHGSSAPSWRLRRVLDHLRYYIWQQYVQFLTIAQAEAAALQGQIATLNPLLRTLFG
jgi:hypothetical protein